MRGALVGLCVALAAVAGAAGGVLAGAAWERQRKPLKVEVVPSEEVKAGLAKAAARAMVSNDLKALRRRPTRALRGRGVGQLGCSRVAISRSPTGVAR